MLAIIGSLALSNYTKLDRSPSDIDLVGDYDEIVAFMKKINCTTIYPIDEGKKLVGKSKDVIVEAEITWENSSAAELYALIADDPNSTQTDNLMFASLDMLYALKMTHRFKKNSPHFLKTMRDIQLMRQLGASIKDEHRAFYNRRKKETLNYKHPKLDQNKRDFFTDDVPYVYDHDSIHETVKLYEKPAYSYFKPDEAEVLTSKKLFDALPHEMRLAAVYEESCVLALERSQIPYPMTDKLKSFQMALGKVCTSITSGWFRTFAWENYDAAMALYYTATKDGYNYVDCFKHGLNNGVVTLHRK